MGLLNPERRYASSCNSLVGPSLPVRYNLMHETLTAVRVAVRPTHRERFAEFGRV